MRYFALFIGLALGIFWIGSWHHKNIDNLVVRIKNVTIDDFHEKAIYFNINGIEFHESFYFKKEGLKKIDDHTFEILLRGYFSDFISIKSLNKGHSLALNLNELDFVGLNLKHPSKNVYVEVGSGLTGDWMKLPQEAEYSYDHRIPIKDKNIAKPSYVFNADSVRSLSKHYQPTHLIIIRTISSSILALLVVLCIKKLALVWGNNFFVGPLNAIKILLKLLKESQAFQMCLSLSVYSITILLFASSGVEVGDPWFTSSLQFSSFTKEGYGWLCLFFYSLGLTTLSPLQALLSVWILYVTVKVLDTLKVDKRIIYTIALIYILMPVTLTHIVGFHRTFIDKMFLVLFLLYAFWHFVSNEKEFLSRKMIVALICFVFSIILRPTEALSIGGVALLSFWVHRKSFIKVMIVYICLVVVCLSAFIFQNSGGGKTRILGYFAARLVYEDVNGNLSPPLTKQENEVFRKVKIFRDGNHSIDKITKSSREWGHIFISDSTFNYADKQRRNQDFWELTFEKVKQHPLLYLKTLYEKQKYTFYFAPSLPAFQIDNIRSGRIYDHEMFPLREISKFKLVKLNYEILKYAGYAILLVVMAIRKRESLVFFGTVLNVMMHITTSYTMYWMYVLDAMLITFVLYPYVIQNMIAFFGKTLKSKNA